MDKPDNENDTQIHFTLSAYERGAVQFVKVKMGLKTKSQVMRNCLRSAAQHLGYPREQDIFDK